MENRRQRRVSPFPYLLLNILLSALTTLLVLWLWNRAQAQKLPDDAAIQALLQNSELPTQAATPDLLPPLPSLDSQVIEIINVFGAGDLGSEEIVLQNISQEEEIWLDGWTLTTSAGDSYTFQSLVLNPNARVQIYTRAGQDTVNKLYWNLSKAALETGGKITLEDYEGICGLFLPFPDRNRMNIFDQISEQKIQAAMQRGDFENLPGSGKPIQWEENLLAPEDQKLAFDLIQHNGFTLPWIEKRIDVRDGVNGFRQSLINWATCNPFSAACDLPSGLQEMLCELNKKIMDYNMSVPVESLQVSFIDANRELEHLRNNPADSSRTGAG